MRAALAGLGGFSLSYLAKKWVFHPKPMGRSDQKILNKVRSKAERLLRFPELLQVHVHQGRVSLSGTVLSHEEDHLIKQLLSIRGVTRLKNSIRTVSDRSELSVPGTESSGTVIIAGEPSPAGHPTDLRNASALSSDAREWAKSVGLVASGALGVLLAIGLARRGWLGERVAKRVSPSVEPPSPATPLRAA